MISVNLARKYRCQKAYSLADWFLAGHYQLVIIHTSFMIFINLVRNYVIQNHPHPDCNYIFRCQKFPPWSPTGRQRSMWEPFEVIPCFWECVCVCLCLFVCLFVCLCGLLVCFREWSRWVSILESGTVMCA